MRQFRLASEQVATLTLPYPPTINNYYGYNSRTGAKFIKAGGKAYRLQVIEILRQALPKREPNTEKLSVWIVANVPDKRVRDLDNISKALLDAITHAKVIWADDYNIDDLRIVRGSQIKGGSVTVYVRKIICDGN